MAVPSAGGALLPYQDQRFKGNLVVDGTVTAAGNALTSSSLTSPIITNGLTAVGSASNDFSGSTGTFKTSSGANTLGGAVTGSSSIKSNSATGGIGYAAGAGGAVTQASSRTTGVTLNKVCGAITLVSAAGSATPFTMTVTNSTVTALDTVVACQKSGTDAYGVAVSAVGAGSFALTITDLTGTTTEQPVINFAVVKAVAS
jgi:hypothetical protein